jgi:hypothetical protein
MTDDRERILDRFIRDGRLVAFPARRSRRRIILERVVQDFEPGRHYSEGDVNDILRRFNADVATLRRYLVDEELMDRAEGEYWRCGGVVEED